MSFASASRTRTATSGIASSVSWSPMTEIVSPIQNERNAGVRSRDGTNRRVRMLIGPAPTLAVGRVQLPCVGREPEALVASEQAAVPEPRNGLLRGRLATQQSGQQQVGGGRLRVRPA